MARATPGSAVTGGVSWALVADKVRTRSEKQCRSKWLNYLNWKHSGGTEWTKEDDQNLIQRSRGYLDAPFIATYGMTKCNKMFQF